MTAFELLHSADRDFPGTYLNLSTVRTMVAKFGTLTSASELKEFNEHLASFSYAAGYVVVLFLRATFFVCAQLPAVVGR